MEKFLHKLFLRNNKVEPSEFSKPLQNKMGIFDKKKALLDKLKGDERMALYLDMEELDQELLEDILEEMQDRLENNDIEDDEPLKSGSVSLQKDEQLLDSLWQSGKTRELSRSFLEGLGLRTRISGWIIPVGKYTLYRTAVFRYLYNLKKRK